MTINTYAARLSPSGPLIGTPPGQVGGGSTVPGRVWLAQGSGEEHQVPGTAAGSITGLDAVTVDLKPGVSGYRYDIEFEAPTFGTGGGFALNVAESTDGINYTVIYVPQGLLLFSGHSRLHITDYSNPHAVPIVSLKCLLVRDVPADASLTYIPDEASLRVREWSTS